MNNQDRIDQLKREIKEKEALIETKRNEIQNILLNIKECTSHIYKRDLWNVGRCVFCGRIEF